MKKSFIYISFFTAILFLSCSSRADKQNQGDSVITSSQTDKSDDADVMKIDFSMSDINGKTVSAVDEFAKHQITIVDFWASWCGPCRREMPNLVKINNKYRDKGLGIVGVSLDNDEAQWKSAVKDMNMNWVQLSDLQGWHNAVAVKYGISSIPFMIIVDKTGKILQSDLRGEELETFVDNYFNDNK